MALIFLANPTSLSSSHGSYTTIWNRKDLRFCSNRSHWINCCLSWS